MKKKIIAVVLIVVMVVCNSSTVWADLDTSSWNDTSGFTGGDSREVSAIFNTDPSGSTLYSVTITWDALTYTYDGKVVLDGTTYKASGEETTWTSTSNTIKVENNSAGKVNAKLTYNAGTTVEGVEGKFSNATNQSSFILGTSAIPSSGEISKTETLTILGKPTIINTTVLSGIVLGTVKVEITTVP